MIPQALPIAVALVDPYGTAPLTAAVVVGLEAHTVSVRITHPTCSDVGTVWDMTTGDVQRAYGGTELAGDGQTTIPLVGLCEGTSRVRILTHGPDGRHIGVLDLTTSTTQDNGEVVTHTTTDPPPPGWTWWNGRVYDHDGAMRWVGEPIHDIDDEGLILSREDRMTWLGQTLPRTLDDPYERHHGGTALPDGEALLPATDLDAATVEDVVLHVDADGATLQAWDMADYLDPSRLTLSPRADDWCHVNTAALDEPALAGPSLVVSCKYQGIARVEAGALDWVLGPHLDWPAHLQPHLLTAVDAQGVAYPADVQEAVAADPSWHWPIGHHGLSLWREADGLHLVTWAASAGRLFAPGTTGNDAVNSDTSDDRGAYSLLAEYLIDEGARTVRMLDSYGEGDAELYGSYNGHGARLNSGYLVAVSNGHDPDEPVMQAHVVTLAPDWTEVAHLTVDNLSGESAYRGGRVRLYQPWVMP